VIAPKSAPLQNIPSNETGLQWPICSYKSCLGDISDQVIVYKIDSGLFLTFYSDDIAADICKTSSRSES